MGCNKCNNNPCDKCSPKPCQCHPCYNTLVGDCKQPCGEAKPIECLDNAYCDDGCETFLKAECIIFTDGETLETKFTNLMTILTQISECVCDNTGGCPSLGTISGNNNICI